MNRTKVNRNRPHGGPYCRCGARAITWSNGIPRCELHITDKPATLDKLREAPTDEH